jgi:hypothetical protein
MNPRHSVCVHECRWPAIRSLRKYSQGSAYTADPEQALPEHAARGPPWSLEGQLEVLSNHHVLEPLRVLALVAPLGQGTAASMVWWMHAAANQPSTNFEPEVHKKRDVSEHSEKHAWGTYIYTPTYVGEILRPKNLTNIGWCVNVLPPKQDLAWCQEKPSRTMQIAARTRAENSGRRLTQRRHHNNTSTTKTDIDKNTNNTQHKH